MPKVGYSLARVPKAFFSTSQKGSILGLFLEGLCRISDANVRATGLPPKDLAIETAKSFGTAPKSTRPLNSKNGRAAREAW